MSKNLIYGKITCSYEETFDSSIPCRPFPMIRIRPFFLNGKKVQLHLGDKLSMRLLNFKTLKKLTLEDLYKKWIQDQTLKNLELGEGRALFEWMKEKQISILWKKTDIIFHSFFSSQKGLLKSNDDVSREHAFSIPPVRIKGRNIKLYVKDEDIQQLIHLPRGEESDFLELIRSYLDFRIEREKTPGPTHSFLEWIKFMGKRPVFLKGQLTWDTNRYF